jgi:hypothetical protein
MAIGPVFEFIFRPQGGSLKASALIGQTSIRYMRAHRHHQNGQTELE